MSEPITDITYIDKNIMDALEELRWDVEHINKWGSSQFRERIIGHDEVASVTYNGIVYGYKLHDRGNGFMEREIMIRPADGGNFDLEHFSDLDREKIVLPVFEVFFREGYTDIEPEVIRGCLVFRQKFQISHLFERNPGIVVPGRKW